MAKLKLILLITLVFLLQAPTASAQGIQSSYTDLAEKKCKILKTDTEGAGYTLARCPGVAGYSLLMEEIDLRQTLTLVRPNGSKNLLDLVGTVGSGGFSSVGSKAEWRIKRQGSKIVPLALIVRFNVSEDGSRSEKNTSYLVVAKITPKQVCITDVVRPNVNANEEARRLADESADKPCLSSPE